MLIRLCLALLLTCSAWSYDERPLTWPQDNSPYATDPAVTWGQLPNGLRYAVMHNEQPPGKASVRLYIRAGSWQETEPERGLAHFLEHLAFNGSEHFPPGTLIDRLQALGIAFGSHSNAHTSFDETVYKLDLPSTDDAIIDTALLVFADTADRLLIQTDEVDKERGIIMAEMRDRDGPDMRIWQQLYPAMFPGLTVGHRFPIGTAETVQAISAETMRAWYDGWYRSDRMILTVVGDIEPAAIVARIEAQFGGITLPEAAPSHPDYGDFTAADSQQFLVIHESEADGTTVLIHHSGPATHLHDTPERRRRDTALAIASQVFGRRMAALAEHPATPFVGAGMHIDSDFGVNYGRIWARPKDGQALATVTMIEQEWRRFLTYGPTAGEVATVRSAITAGLDDAVAKVGLRRNNGLADALFRSVVNDSVFQTPAQQRDDTLAIVNALTAEAVHATLTAAAQLPQRLVCVAGREDLGPEAEATLAATWAAAAAEPVSAPADKAATTWAYGERPAAIEPVSVDQLDHGIERRIYANNIHVHLLARAAKPNEVLLRSLLHIPAEVRPPGITDITGMAFQGGGLGAHDAADLRDVLAAVRSRVGGPGFNEQGATFGGSCTPEELEAALQQWRAWLTDPAWRPEPLQQSRSAWLEALATEHQDLEKVFARRMNLLTDGLLPQRRGPSLAEAEALTIDQAKAWFEPIRINAPIEVAIVGDVDPDQARSLADAYIGSLPTRAPLPVTVDLSAPDALAPTPRIEAGAYRFTVQTEVARAIAALIWPTDDQGDIRRWRREGILSQVLRERLRKRVREELGDAYSPYAGRRNSVAYEGSGYCFAYTSIAPDRVDEVVRIIEEEAAKLVSDGIAEEDFNAVMTPLLKNIESYLDGNGYWANQVALQASSQPQRLDWAKTVLSDNQDMTIDEVNAAAKAYLKPENRLLIIGISPAKPAD